MSLDKLISKYLDSELNAAEDQELRRMIAEDERAKKDFDESVSLHLAIKDDARSIKVPADLLRETEDKILMQILKQPPVIISSQPLRSSAWSGTYSLAAMVAFFLFISIFKISDLNFNLFNKGISSNEAVEKTIPETAVLSRSAKSINNYKNAEKEQITDASSATSEGISIESSSLQTFQEPALIQPDLTPNAKQDIEVIGYEDNNRPDLLKNSIKINPNDIKESRSGSKKEFSALSEMPSLPSAILKQNPVSLNSKYSGGFIDISSSNLLDRDKNIELASHLGTRFYIGEIDEKSKKAISDFSQSIAYSISDRSKLGLEFGYSELSYFETREVKVPVSSNGNTIEGYEPGNELHYIAVPVELERQRQMFWASGVFDYSLINSSWFKLESRLGAGLSADGPLSYVRVLGKLRLVSTLYLVAGTEAKAFSLKTAKTGSESKWKSSGSFIYGLQFGF